jgi:hypothetical protein
MKTSSEEKIKKRRLRPERNGYDNRKTGAENMQETMRQRDVVKYGSDLVEVLDSIKSDEFWNP